MVANFNNVTDHRDVEKLFCLCVHVCLSCEKTNCMLLNPYDCKQL